MRILARLLLESTSNLESKKSFLKKLNMKNTLKILAAFAALGVASVASAVNIPASGKVTMYNTPIDGGLSGGIFKGVVTGQGSFYTYCIEFGTSIVFNNEINYELSNKTASAIVAKDGDVISKATAYLFKEFSLGNLLDPTSDSADAGLLQQAFWHLEDEVTLANPDANPFLLAVKNLYGTYGAAMADDDVGEVMVMNLTSASGRDIQDVLVYHVSETGLTLALLGATLTVLGFARRRIS